MSTAFESLISRGLRADQPAAGKPGRLYHVTDEGVVERDNGSTWDLFAVVVSGGAGSDTTAIHTDGVFEFDDMPEVTTLQTGDRFLVELVDYGTKAWIDKDNLPSGGGGGGGRTLIEEKTPTGTGTVTFSSIVATYKKLVLEIAVRSTQSANDVNGYLQFNGDATAGDYYYNIHRLSGFGASNDSGASYYFANASVPGANANADGFLIGKIEIIQYANVNFRKVALIDWGTADNGFYQQARGALQWLSKTAIDRIDVILSAGNYVSGSVLRLYGED